MDAQRQCCSLRAGVWHHQVTDSKGEMLYRQRNRDVSSLTTEAGLHPDPWDCCWSMGLHSSLQSLPTAVVTGLWWVSICHPTGSTQNVK